jgi:hypothetical protein
MARPVYLQQRTYLMSVATALECQNRTLAVYTLTRCSNTGNAIVLV